MSLLADGLLIIAALVATVYCVVLSRRLARLNGMDEGVGRAIVELSSRVDIMNAALVDAKSSNEAASETLRSAIKDASVAETRLAATIALAKRTSEIDSQDTLGEQHDRINEPSTPDSSLETDAVRSVALTDTLSVIGEAPSGEDDDAFASRLVGAMSALQPMNGAKI